MSLIQTPVGNEVLLKREMQIKPTYTIHCITAKCNKRHCITFTVGQLITFSVKLYYIYGGVSYYI